MVSKRFFKTLIKYARLFPLVDVDAIWYLYLDICYGDTDGAMEKIRNEIKALEEECI